MLVLGALQLRAAYQLHIPDRRLRRRLPIRQPDPVLQRLDKRFLVGIALVRKPVADIHYDRPRRQLRGP